MPACCKFMMRRLPGAGSVKPGGNASGWERECQEAEWVSLGRADMSYLEVNEFGFALQLARSLQTPHMLLRPLLAAFHLSTFPCHRAVWFLPMCSLPQLSKGCARVVG